MSTTTFDKLLYLETLKASGVPEEQAKAHAHALDEALRDGVATKADVESLEQKIDIMERDLKIWFGTAMIAAVGVILAAIRYLPPRNYPPTPGWNSSEIGTWSACHDA